MKTMKLAGLLALTQLAMTPTAFAADDGVSIGGFARVNYAWKDYSDSSKDKGGDFSWDALSLTMDGKVSDIGISVDYRLANGLDYVKRAYGYMDFGDATQVQVGIVKNPFGKQGFVSNSYWFSVNYYLGLEDDYDAGIKLTHDQGNWHLDAAFLKSAEYGKSNLNRYAPDVVGADEETNQFNLRGVYTLPLENGHLKLGASAMTGQLYNSELGENGDRFAAALHGDLVMGPWNLQLQASTYKHDAAAGGDTVTVGILGAQYDIASEADSYIVNLSRRFDTSWGSVTLYNDYGMVQPKGSGQDDSIQNVTGMLINRGPVWAYFDYIVGKNMTFAGGPGVGLANPDAPTDSRINISLSYYF